jgi:hypothetical protein
VFRAGAKTLSSALPFTTLFAPFLSLPPAKPLPVPGGKTLSMLEFIMLAARVITGFSHPQLLISRNEWGAQPRDM